MIGDHDRLVMLCGRPTGCPDDGHHDWPCTPWTPQSVSSTGALAAAGPLLICRIAAPP